MEKYNLFLDDIRNPEACLNYKTEHMPEDRSIYSLSEWTIARSYEEFIKIIREGLSEGKFPELISFDHDLADVHYDPESRIQGFSYKEETGKECADFLVNFCIDNQVELPHYYIHSANPTGRERIHQSLQDYYRYKKIKEMQ